MASHLLRSYSRTAISISIHCADFKSSVDVVAGSIGVIEEVNPLCDSPNEFPVLQDLIVGNPIVIAAGRPRQFNALDTQVCSQLLDYMRWRLRKNVVGSGSWIMGKVQKYQIPSYDFIELDPLRHQFRTYTAEMQGGLISPHIVRLSWQKPSRINDHRRHGRFQSNWLRQPGVFET